MQIPTSNKSSVSIGEGQDVLLEKGVSPGQTDIQLVPEKKPEVQVAKAPKQEISDSYRDDQGRLHYIVNPDTGVQKAKPDKAVEGIEQQPARRVTHYEVTPEVPGKRTMYLADKDKTIEYDSREDREALTRRIYDENYANDDQEKINGSHTDLFGFIPYDGQPDFAGDLAMRILAGAQSFYNVANNAVINGAVGIIPGAADWAKNALGVTQMKQEVIDAREMAQGSGWKKYALSVADSLSNMAVSMPTYQILGLMSKVAAVENMVGETGQQIAKFLASKRLPAWALGQAETEFLSESEKGVGAATYAAVESIVTGGAYHALPMKTIPQMIMSIPAMGSIGVASSILSSLREKGHLPKSDEIIDAAIEGGAMAVILSFIPILIRATDHPRERRALNNLAKVIYERMKAGDKDGAHQYLDKYYKGQDLLVVEAEDGAKVRRETAIERIKDLAKKLGVKIDDIVISEEEKFIDYDDPNDIATLKQHGMTEEDIKNDRQNNIVWRRHGEHIISVGAGGTKRSRITLYKGYTEKDVYHEFAHAVEEQGGIPGWYGTKEQHAKYLEDVLGKGMEGVLVEFTENGAKVSGQNVTYDGTVSPNDNAASIRTYEEHMLEFIDWNEHTKMFTVPQIKKYFSSLENVARLILENKDLLDYASHEGFSPLKPNTDYGLSLDFTTMCVKRYIMQSTIDAIQEKIGRPLVKSEIEGIHKDLKDRGIDVSCGPCYVEQRRGAWGTVMNKAILKFVWGGDIKDPVKKNKKTGAPAAKSPSDVKRDIQSYRDSGMKPKMDINYFLSQRGLDRLAKDHPDIYKEVRKMTGGTQIKMPEPRTEYSGQILHDISPGMVEEFNRRSGIRLQSWSDFEIQHLLDGMQAVGDMAQKRLKAHAYTKVENFVRAYASTGMAINMSLIPKGNGFNADGSFAWDESQSFPLKNIEKFRKKYPNVGVCAIGISDAHIKALRLNPNIDYIIPYHKSGISDASLKLKGMDGWKDYEDFQNWKRKDGTEMDPNDKIYIGDFKGDMKKFKRMCDKKGVIPPFAEWINEPGYEKLITDRRIRDNNGKYVEQQVVQPVFENAELQKMLKTGKPAPEKAHTPTVNKFVNELNPNYSIRREEADAMARDNSAEILLGQMQELDSLTGRKAKDAESDYDKVADTMSKFYQMSDFKLTRAPSSAEKAAGWIEDEYTQLRLKNSQVDIIARSLTQSVKYTKDDIKAINDYVDQMEVLGKEGVSVTLTPKQKEFYEKVVRPLDKMNKETTKFLVENFDVADDTVHNKREVLGRRSIFDWVKQTTSGFGGVFSRSASALKSRKWRAITDGKERVVILDDKGRIKAYRNGIEEDLGPKNMVKNIDLLKKEIQPFIDLMDKYQKEFDILGSVKVREPVSEAKIANLEEKAATLAAEINDTANTYSTNLEKKELLNDRQARELKQLVKDIKLLSGIKKGEDLVLRQDRMETLAQKIEHMQDLINEAITQYDAEALDDKVFVDKNKKRWDIIDATEDEITLHTGEQYYKDIFQKLLVNFVRLNRAKNAIAFLDGLKESPMWGKIAIDKSSRGASKKEEEGWKPVNQLKNFPGHLFEPRVADALNYLGRRANRSGFEILEKVNDILRTAIFFNPLMHVPNIGAHWFTARGGLNWINPAAYPRLVWTSFKAMKAVATLNMDYLRAMENRLPMQRHSVGKTTLDLMWQKMTNELLQNQSLLEKVGTGLKMAPDKIIRAIYGFSAQITWGSNDFAMLQSYYERRAQGFSKEEAIEHTRTAIPDYVIPSRIWNSRGVSELMSNPMVTMFGAYHYGMLKAHGKVAADLGRFAIGKGSASKALQAADQIAALTLLGLVVYPALDRLAQMFWGDKSAKMRRAGSMTLPSMIGEVVKGTTTWDQALRAIVTPAVAQNMIFEHWFNTDTFTRKRLDQGMDAGEFALNTATKYVQPVELGEKLVRGKTTGEKTIQQFTGVRTGYGKERSAMYRMAEDRRERIKKMKDLPAKEKNARMKELNEKQLKSLEVLFEDMGIKRKPVIADLIPARIRQITGEAEVKALSPEQQERLKKK